MIPSYDIKFAQHGPLPGQQTLPLYQIAINDVTQTLLKLFFDFHKPSIHTMCIQVLLLNTVLEVIIRSTEVHIYTNWGVFSYEVLYRT